MTDLGNPLENATYLSASRSHAYRVFLLVSIFIVLLATSLRVYRISKRSLWLDEASAANSSRGTWREALPLTRGFHSAPITDPLILSAVEKVSTEPLAVRLP